MDILLDCELKADNPGSFIFAFSECLKDLPREAQVEAAAASTGSG
jgi:hypothetical protein